LAAFDSWRWVEQENSRKQKTESQKQEEIRCKLRAACRTLLNTEIDIEDERKIKEDRLRLLMMKNNYLF
jgi:hypothetical protein